LGTGKRKRISRPEGGVLLGGAQDSTTVSAVAAALVAKPSSACNDERVRARRSEMMSMTMAESDTTVLLANPQQQHAQRAGLKIPRTFYVIDLSHQSVEGAWKEKIKDAADILIMAQATTIT
jgi:hypothetical protein